MLVAEFLVNFTYRGVLLQELHSNPDKFWHWSVPYNVAIKLAFVALIFVKGRRSNIAALIVLNLLFLAPYWFI
jgi:hypothetical protein